MQQVLTGKISVMPVAGFRPIPFVILAGGLTRG